MVRKVAAELNVIPRLSLYLVSLIADKCTTRATKTETTDANAETALHVTYPGSARGICGFDMCLHATLCILASSLFDMFDKWSKRRDDKFTSAVGMNAIEASSARAAATTLVPK